MSTDSTAVEASPAPHRVLLRRATAAVAARPGRIGALVLVACLVAALVAATAQTLADPAPPAVPESRGVAETLAAAAEADPGAPARLGPALREEGYRVRVLDGEATVYDNDPGGAFDVDSRALAPVADGDGAVVVNLVEDPADGLPPGLVTWIWLGPGLVLLGGALALGAGLAGRATRRR